MFGFFIKFVDNCMEIIDGYFCIFIAVYVISWKKLLNIPFHFGLSKRLLLWNKTNGNPLSLSNFKCKSHGISRITDTKYIVSSIVDEGISDYVFTNVTIKYQFYYVTAEKLNKYWRLKN